MSSALGLVVTVLAILAGAGAAAAFLSSGRNKGRLDALRGDVADRDRRIEFLEAANERHEETEDRQQRVIEHLQGEVATLREVVTGQSGPVRDLSDLVHAHHDAAITHLDGIDKKVDDVLRLLGDKRAPRTEI